MEQVVLRESRSRFSLSIAVRVFNQAVVQVRAIPFAPEIKTDLTGYVVERGMAGIFHYLAQEEAAIRRNPAKRTTELLQRIFGAR